MRIMSYAAPLGLVLGGLVVAGPAAAAPAPVNDSFADALEVTGELPISVTGSNAGATAEPGEPEHVIGQPAAASVWWTWTAAESATVQISLRGSAFDTLLAVYTGGALDELAPIASDDDTYADTDYLSGSPTHYWGTSAAILDARAGTTYAIAVDGYDAGTGDIALTIGPAAGLGGIAGGVTDRAGAPLAGVTVLAELAGGDYGITRTDAAGDYLLDQLPPGDHPLWFVWAGRAWPGAPVRVAPGETTAAGRVALGDPAPSGPEAPAPPGPEPVACQAAQSAAAAATAEYATRRAAYRMLRRQARRLLAQVGHRPRAGRELRRLRPQVRAAKRAKRAAVRARTRARAAAAAACS